MVAFPTIRPMNTVPGHPLFLLNPIKPIDRRLNLVNSRFTVIQDPLRNSLDPLVWSAPTLVRKSNLIFYKTRAIPSKKGFVYSDILGPFNMAAKIQDGHQKQGKWVEIFDKHMIVHYKTVNARLAFVGNCIQTK